MTANAPDSNILTREELDAIDGQAQVLIAQGSSRGLAGVVRTGETIARLVAHVRALHERLDRWADNIIIGALPPNDEHADCVPCDAWRWIKSREEASDD